MIITNAIKYHRQEAGYTQKELADLVGTSQMQISHIETGRRMPALKLLMRLATVLGCTLDELAGDYAEEGSK